MYPRLGPMWSNLKQQKQDEELSPLGLLSLVPFLQASQALHPPYALRSEAVNREKQVSTLVILTSPGNCGDSTMLFRFATEKSSKYKKFALIATCLFFVPWSWSACWISKCSQYRSHFSRSIWLPTTYYFCTTVRLLRDCMVRNKRVGPLFWYTCNGLDELQTEYQPNTANQIIHLLFELHFRSLQFLESLQYNIGLCERGQTKWTEDSKDVNTPRREATQFFSASVKIRNESCRMS